jgi:pyrophosphatase PpaX
MIKAILFDVDGVLMDSFEANLQFFGDLLDKFGHRRPERDEFAPIFHLTMLDTIKHFTKSKDEEEVLKIWEGGKSSNADYTLMKTPENSEEIIALLSQNYALGIVTSKIKANIFKPPQMQNIQKYFQTAVGYDDVVNHKPHPEPVLLALKNLGVSPEEAIYIGDMESDIKAGKSAGVKVIHFSKNGLPEADAVAYSFAELPNIIKNL